MNLNQYFEHYCDKDRYEIWERFKQWLVENHADLFTEKHQGAIEECNLTQAVRELDSNKQFYTGSHNETFELEFQRLETQKQGKITRHAFRTKETTDERTHGFLLGIHHYEDVKAE